MFGSPLGRFLGVKFKHFINLMFLKDTNSGSLVKVVDVNQLFIPTTEAVEAQLQAGQNEQPTRSFEKQSLVFPSGEKLPQCWVDPNYRSDLPAQPQAS